MTRIPVRRVAETEGQKLLKMNEELAEKIIGQNHAIKSLTKAIQRSRAGLKSEGRPIGVYLFLGPTGVGKTETGKWFENLFSNEKIGSALKGVGTDLVKSGLGLDPRITGQGGDPRLNPVSASDTFRSRFKIQQAGINRPVFPLGNSGLVVNALKDINVQEQLVKCVSTNNK